jgi:hypothetical protein
VRRKSLLAITILLLVLAGVAAAWLWKTNRDVAASVSGAALGTPATRSNPTDPRLTYASPYRNIGPDVKYVGDEACTGCHRSIAKTYRQHPMGRSLASIESAPVVERFDQQSRNPFEALGFRYQVEQAGNRARHKEMATGPHGQTLAEIAADVHYVVGSGQRGRSYLINRDGYLFLSPITWYPLKQIWDLSPGYTERNNPHFGRPVVAGCLFCHANQVEPVAETANRYRFPLFRGPAIGCERCHGPGELHVERRRAHEEISDRDDTIVNPRHLEHALREAVCQQCHLQGEQRVLRRDRAYFDYRPGLPLQLFFTDFVKPREQKADNKFVGTVEQMYASRCFHESREPNKLGCISCHDPHARPTQEEKVTYFRARCLHCHQERGCSLSLAIRRQKTKGDDCIACHMPRTGSEINHTAITDHLIPRDGDKAAQLAPPGAWPREGEMPLIPFPMGLANPIDAETARDLGVALVEFADQQPDRSARQLAERALPLLEASLAAGPEDVPAWDAKASALWFLRRLEEAWAAYEASLAKAPERELTLFRAATLAARTKRFDKAGAYCRRVIEVNPWRWQYYHLLAGVHSQRQDWSSAGEACRHALQLNPANLAARRLLISSYLRLGKRDQAQAEFETFLGLHPPQQHEALRRWFDRQ